MRATGILVDLWHRASKDGAPGAYMLWLRTGEDILCLEDREFRPSFSIIPERNVALVEHAVAQHENVTRVETAMRYPSIYSDEKVPVIRAFMQDERRVQETMREIKLRAPASVSFAEAKIRIDLQWHYLRNIAPGSKVTVEHDGGVLKSITRMGPGNTDDLRMMAVHPVFSGTRRAPWLKCIAIRSDTTEWSMSGREEEMLKELQAIIDKEDPDVLALFDADNEKFPLLGKRAAAHGMKLRLGRVPWPTALYEDKMPTGGKVSHWQAPQVRAPGRITMDLWKDARTDADLKRTDLSLGGVYGAEFEERGKSEVAMVYRLARERLPMFTSWCDRCMMPLDSVCREKHGFMNASVVNYTMIGTTVVPEQAEYPEGFKTSLIETLKENGGLVVTPEAGLHEDVGIVDFSSLFPRVFVKHNISPETINCKHEECRLHGEKVPFLDFHICMKRRGVYPEVFGKVLDERDRVKRIMKTLDPESPEYRRMEILHKSLKMQLVSPYGYMQFHLNNFRTVDGNRSVPAFGRWYLLKARDIAEDAGFNVIYADTDSLFLQRAGATMGYQEFCDKISKDLGMDIKLEHECRWVLFLPEHAFGKKGLKKKYFCSEGGVPLVRGLEVRRQDRARVAKDVQDRALHMLAEAHNEKEFREKIPQVVAYVRTEALRITEGDLNAEELVIVKKLSRRPEEYKAAMHHCVAAEALASSGRSVRVGGKVEYIITGKKKATPVELAGEHPEYDVKSYLENTVHPIFMLLREFGVKYEDLLPGPRQATLEKYGEVKICPA